MGTVLQDLRYGLRMLRKSPGFALVAIITLALGIGANTAMFSVVNGVLLQPLPYRDPGRLVRVYMTELSQGFRDFGASPPDFRAMRERNQSFDGLAAYYNTPVNLTGVGEPVRLLAGVASSELFRTLGVAPVLGRDFKPDEEQWGAHRVVLLADRCWRERLGADPHVVGRILDLNGEPFTVVGVLPRNFFLQRDQQMWVPMAWAPHDNENSRNNHFLKIIGRLKPGVTRPQAFTDLNSTMAALAQQFPENQGLAADLQPLRDSVVGEVQTSLLVLLGAVSFVLLIACANLANLLLARAVGRQKEIAIRAALGASRARLLRQLVTESVLLALVGGALGLLLAFWALAVLPLSPQSLPRAQQIHIDVWVLLFTFGVSVLTGILFGLAPAFHGARSSLEETLRQGGRSALPGRGANRARSGLVISEVALALVLLIGAGLLLKSFSRLLRVDAGFDPRRVLTFEINLPPAYVPRNPLPPTGNGAPPRMAEFYRQLLARIQTLPGVAAVGAISSLPLAGDVWGKYITFTDRPAPTSVDQVPLIQYRSVAGDYFQALQIPVLKGRTFQASDQRGAPPVAIINRALARRYWPGADPIGKQITTDIPENLTPPGLLPPGYKVEKLTIVGVVDDVHYGGLASDAVPLVYASMFQEDWSQNNYVTVRAQGDPSALLGAIRHEVAQIDRNQPISNVATMEQIVSDSVAQPRLESLLLGIFGGVALLLAIVGIYGVMSYSVAQRTHEIGVRIALGAARPDVLKLVVGQGFRLVVAGLLLGLGLGLLLTRALARLLFGVSPNDPLTFSALAALLATIALLACYLPARRAARVDPMVALRYE